MKWVLIMTLVSRFGVSIDHVEFNREGDCHRAAVAWVASQHKYIAKATCVEKHK